MNSFRTPSRSYSNLHNVMIVALEPIEFIPCGRLAIADHPGVACLHLHQSQALVRLDHSLVGSFSQVCLDDRSKDSETWLLRKYRDAEEELYVCGHTVVWSRGYNVINTFTLDSPIKHATWCSFSANGDDPHVATMCKDPIHEEPKETVEGVAVVCEGTLHVFTRDGDDYVTALPFHARKVWNTKLGLIFERSPQQSESISHPMSTNAQAANALTTVFCLQHPLREFAPVITKSQGGVRYMNRSRVSIVFCEDDLVMTFDVKHGLHTVWRARKITAEDGNLLDNNMTQHQQHNQSVQQISSIRQMTVSSPGISPMRASYRNSPAASLLQNAPNVSNSGMHLGLARTPHTSRNPSYAHLSHTPNSTRLCSPSAASINFQSHTFSPLRHSPHLIRSPSTPMSHESLCLNDSVHESAEPLRPEICFEHVWSEGVVGTREGLNVGRATRAFLTEDVCGHKYLAYYVDNLRHLRLVKYGLSNDKSQLIFGAVTSLPARDATPLKEIRMLALLDLVGTITLYTGIVKMVKMHVSGIPMSSLSLSHGLRNATPSLGTPQPVSTPAHPSRPGSVLGSLDEVGMLSPVPELTYSGGDGELSLMALEDYNFTGTGQTSPITGLPQVAGTNLLLELSNGSYFRTEVPLFCTTTLVETCMKGLHYILPSDTYLQLTIKWYALRHSPGSMASYQSEWAIFEVCLREVIGYSTSSKRTLNRSQVDADTSVSPVVAAKKARHIQQGNSADWEYLLRSEYNEKQCNIWSHVGNSILSDVTLADRTDKLEPKLELLNKSKKRSSLDRSTDRSTSTLHPLCAIFAVLHLIYEDQKLNIMTWKNVPIMSKFLHQIANDMGLTQFARGYAMDNALLVRHTLAGEGDQDFKLPPSFSPRLDPNIFSNLLDLCKNGNTRCPFPVIPGVTDRTKHIIKIYNRLFKEGPGASTVELESILTKPMSNKTRRDAECRNDEQVAPTSSAARSHLALRYMVDIGMTNQDLHTLPHGVALPILMALHQCKEILDLDLPDDALKLIGRTDLLYQNSSEMRDWQEAPLSVSTDPKRLAWQAADGASPVSGDLAHCGEDQELITTILAHEQLANTNPHDQRTVNQKSQKQKNKCSLPETADDNVTRLLFPNDHRVSEVRRLLQPDKQVKIDLTQGGTVVGHQEMAEQGRARLLQLCNRKMALAVGRGMVTLGTEKPSPTEPFVIPQLDLSGRVIPGNTTIIESNNTDATSNVKDWPQFHNGAAAGLTISSQKDDSSWIHLNRPKQEDQNGEYCRHAGFLLALGLTGHLEKLHTLNVHDYLSKTRAMTTIGLLLGLGAAKCGTCDLGTMRLFSVHVPALLPPTSTEFDLPRVVQTAAVTAVGFLYLGSGQRLVAEVMLREIDRPPSQESDSSHDREAYALSCGMALGAITLGRGSNIPELADLNLPDHLYHYMTGRKKRADELSSLSTILEGDQVNTDVTAPGAILALTLMFLKTNNVAVADWFSAPPTLLLLEAIKPQHLMLRTMAKALVLWDFVTPTKEWVESHIPEVIQHHMKEASNSADAGAPESSPPTVDTQTVQQCHAFIVTGASLALGLRFAGSQNKGAYETLVHYVSTFLSAWNKQSGTLGVASTYPLEGVGRYTLETCLTTCLLALSMVVAGSGDMKTLQICRFLHVRVGAEVSYGMQMATHMALGFLFLGGCRQTLCTSNKAIVALLASVYPCYPSSSRDNQYHLQALRHFYVLAAEKRLLVPVDSATKLPSYARVGVTFSPLEGSDNEHSYSLMAPCLLPELNHLKQVAVDDPRHWPITVDVLLHPEKLRKLLDTGMAVQRRTGYQPYIQDPKGQRSLLARTTDFSSFEVKWNALLGDDAFNTQTFAEVYLKSCSSKDDSDDAIINGEYEAKRASHLSALLKSLVTQEKTQVIYAFHGLQEMCHQITRSNHPSPLVVWQLKMAGEYLKRRRDMDAPVNAVKGDMSGKRFLDLLSSEVENHFRNFLKIIKPTLQSLLGISPRPAQSARPRRTAKRKDVQAEMHSAIPPLANSSWTSEISAQAVGQLTCFCIYNSLPSSFMFPSSKERGVKVNTGSKDIEILSALKSQNISGPGSVQLFKVLSNVDDEGP